MFDGYNDGIGRSGYRLHDAPHLLRKVVPSIDEALNALGQTGLGGFGGNFNATPARFIFRPRTGRLNWRLLHSLDLDRVVHDGDVETIQAHMDNVMFARFDREDFELCTDESVVKVVKLAQLQMEFLYSVATTSQSMLQGLVEKAKLQSAQLKGSKNRPQQNSSSVPRTSHRRSRSREANERRAGSACGAAHKCLYCNKRFQSEQYLLGHIMRRHQGDYLAGKSPSPAVHQVVTQPQPPLMVTTPHLQQQPLLASPLASAHAGADPVDQERLVAIVKDATSGIQGQMQVVTKDIADSLREMKEMVKQDVERVGDKVKVVADDIVKLQLQQSAANTPRKEGEASRTPLPSPSAQQVVDVNALALLEKKHAELEQCLERKLLNKIEEKQAELVAVQERKEPPPQSLQPQLEEVRKIQEDVQLKLQQRYQLDEKLSAEMEKMSQMQKYVVTAAEAAKRATAKAEELAKQAEAQKATALALGPSCSVSYNNNVTEIIMQDSVAVPTLQAKLEPPKSQPVAQQQLQQQQSTHLQQLEQKPNSSSAWQEGAGVGNMESGDVTLDGVDERQNAHNSFAKVESQTDELLSTIQKTKEPRKPKKGKTEENLDHDQGKNRPGDKITDDTKASQKEESAEQSKEPEVVETPQQRQRGLVQKVFKRSLQEFFWHCRPDLRLKSQRPQENPPRQDAKQPEGGMLLPPSGTFSTGPVTSSQLQATQLAGTMPQGGMPPLDKGGQTLTAQTGAALLQGPTPQQFQQPGARGSSATEPLLAEVPQVQMPLLDAAQFANSSEMQSSQIAPLAPLAQIPQAKTAEFGDSDSRNLVASIGEDARRNANYGQQLSNEPGVGRTMQGQGWAAADFHDQGQMRSVADMLEEDIEEEEEDDRQRQNARFWKDLSSMDNELAKELGTVEDIVEKTFPNNTSEVSDIPELSGVNDLSNSQLRPPRGIDTPIGNGRPNFDNQGIGIGGTPSAFQSVIQEVDAVESFNMMHETSFDSTSPVQEGNKGVLGGGSQPTQVGITGNVGGTMSGWGGPTRSAPPIQAEVQNNSSVGEVNAVEAFAIQDVDVSSDDQSSPMMSRNRGGAFTNNQPGIGRLNQMGHAPKKGAFDLVEMSMEDMSM